IIPLSTPQPRFQKPLCCVRLRKEGFHIKLRGVRNLVLGLPPAGRNDLHLRIESAQRADRRRAVQPANFAVNNDEPAVTADDSSHGGQTLKPRFGCPAAAPCWSLRLDRRRQQNQVCRALNYLTLTSTCFGFASSRLAKVTRRIPSLNSALTLFMSTKPGIVKLR